MCEREGNDQLAFRLPPQGRIKTKRPPESERNGKVACNSLNEEKKVCIIFSTYYKFISTSISRR